MERNTLLAIVLSFVVLFTYQSIFVAPKTAQSLKNPQATATQSVSTITAAPSNSSSDNAVETTKVVNKTEDYELKTTIADVSYTKMGGSLHKIDFLRNEVFPITDILSIDGFDDGENVHYTGQQVDDNTVSLMYTGKEWGVKKVFEFKGKDLIAIRMEIKNVSGGIKKLSEISNLKNLGFTAFEIDESRMEISQNARESALYEYSVYAKNKVFPRKGNATNFESLNFSQNFVHFVGKIFGVAPQPFNNHNDKRDIKVNWVGFRDRYDAFIMKPEFETKGFEINTDSNTRLNVSINPEDKNLEPGESVAYDFTVYAGPQNPWVMKKYNEGFEKIIAFSNFPSRNFPIVEWVAQGIYHTIPVLHSIFKSWGVAIILISAMIYGITYPMTMQSMLSMRKMQEVQPKIKALQERYKNDPQKLNTEMVEIYRREKINPLGGCLPVFIQMPFFMALYQILWRAQYFQGQGFLWIKDLSQPDRLIIFPFYLPLLGNELNILPLLTGGLMFLQQKISSKNIVATDEQQAMQQKMMMYILPVMMSCMFYKFASSWAIYFLVYYIFTTAAQWKIAQVAAKKNSK